MSQKMQFAPILLAIERLLSLLCYSVVPSRGATRHSVPDGSLSPASTAWVMQGARSVKEEETRFLAGGQVPLALDDAFGGVR